MYYSKATHDFMGSWMIVVALLHTTQGLIKNYNFGNVPNSRQKSTNLNQNNKKPFQKDLVIFSIKFTLFWDFQNMWQSVDAHKFGEHEQLNGSIFKWYWITVYQVWKVYS